MTPAMSAPMSQSRPTARVNTMQKFRWILAAVGALGVFALAGCNQEGTSSFAGTSSSSSSSGTTTASVSSITLLASSPNLLSDNSKPVTITAIARNASNQLVPGAVIDFLASSGGILPVQTTAGSAGTTQVQAGTTDANGIAQAQLTTPGDFANRTITVTAISGGATANLTVNVVGTTLTVTGAANLISGASSTYTIALLDASNNGIPTQTVTIVSKAGNKLSSSTVTTDSLGHASFQLTATVAGSDTITVTALGQSATQALTVSAESFAFETPTTLLPPLNVVQTLTVVWTNNGVPQSGTVTFSTTRGQIVGGSASSLTEPIPNGANPPGTATIQIASTTAGPAVITATAVTGTTTVTTQVSLNFIATVPNAIDLQASPATVAVQGQSTITAIVRDVNDNLVTGQTVDFTLTDVTNGSISVGTAVTNLEGQAQTVYTASITPSAANGVTVAATIPAATAVPQATVKLTVGGQSLFLSLGTGAVVGENANKTQFQLPYVVQAVDAAGNPVANLSLTMAVEDYYPEAIGSQPLTPVAPNNAPSMSDAAYAKGGYVVPLGASKWEPQFAAFCLDEDVSTMLINGLTTITGINTGVLTTAEDLNQNGVLDPGGVATVSPSPVTTDSTGTANVTIYYPEDHATWVQVKLTATATVAGTQTSTSAVFYLPILASYLNNTSATPPGYNSPYGAASDCANPQ